MQLENVKFGTVFKMLMWCSFVVEDMALAYFSNTAMELFYCSGEGNYFCTAFFIPNFTIQKHINLSLLYHQLRSWTPRIIVP